jgi:hypothetical protein
LIGERNKLATWIAHLRIAENLLKEINELHREAFVAGNIAPDAGVPNEDWSSFTPPTQVTHWKDERGIQAEDFYERYVISQKAAMDREYYSFVLGYYIHLLADIEWEKLYEIKKEEPIYKDNLAKDPNFIWRIKEDWYGQDYVYLKEHEDSLFFNCFQHMVKVKDYLDYFPPGAFTQRFQFIREMYLGNYMNAKEDFIYLSKKEMDEFVEKATGNIRRVLYNKER